MGRTSIEWATHSLNPGIYGCKEHSPGCANCYAAAMAHRFPALRGGHDDVTVKRASGVHWTGVVHTLPIGDAIARVRNFKLGRNEGRPRVFVTSMADILHESISVGWMASLVRAMALRPEADWLLLTKRAERWPGLGRIVVEQIGAWPDNVWAGVTAENGKLAEERSAHLLEVPARIRWWSAEPLVGRIERLPPGIGWVVAGGESGSRARPAHPQWFRSLRDQCRAAGVPFFFKQWGEHRPAERGEWGPHAAMLAYDGRRMTAHDRFDPVQGDALLVRVGKHAAGRLLDGREWSEVPRG